MTGDRSIQGVNVTALRDIVTVLQAQIDQLDPPTPPKPATKPVVRVTLDVVPELSGHSAAQAVVVAWLSSKSTFDEISIRGVRRKAKVLTAEVVEVPA